MCHPTCQITDGLHFLCLSELLLDKTKVGDVLHRPGKLTNHAIQIGHCPAFHTKQTHFAVRTDDLDLARVLTAARRQFGYPALKGRVVVRVHEGLDVVDIRLEFRR